MATASPLVSYAVYARHLREQVVYLLRLWVCLGCRMFFLCACFLLLLVLVLCQVHASVCLRFKLVSLCCVLLVFFSGLFSRLICPWLCPRRKTAGNVRVCFSCPPFFYKAKEYYTPSAAVGTGLCPNLSRKVIIRHRGQSICLELRVSDNITGKSLVPHMQSLVLRLSY